MNVTRKDIDANNVVITVSVEKEDYNEKVEKALRDYRKKTNMPGFRPGNVPLGLIKKMYGKAVMAEEVNTIVSDSLINYINENDLSVLGQPLPSETEVEEIDFDTQDSFDFHFDVGLAPEFEVDLDTKDKIPYYEISISDEMIDNQIKSYTSRYGKYEQVDVVADEGLIRGDLIELENGEEKKDGIQSLDAALTITYIKDDEQKSLFVGKSKGDAIIFNPRKAFENDTEISSLLKVKKEEIKELSSDFKLVVNDITRYKESEINQELFDKVFGEGVINSEEELRAKITEQIETNLTSESEYKFAIDIRDIFLKKFKDLTFPEAFLKRWLLVSDKEMNAEKLEKEYPQMIDGLIWHLTKDKIAKDNDLKVEFADVEEYAKTVAKSQLARYGLMDNNTEIIENYTKNMMQDEKNMKSFIDRAMEEKTLAFIRTKVKLDKKKISIEDFNKLFETAEA